MSKLFCQFCYQSLSKQDKVTRFNIVTMNFYRCLHILAINFPSVFFTDSNPLFYRVEYRVCVCFFFVCLLFFFCFSAINAVPTISDVQVCFKQKHIVGDGQKWGSNLKIPGKIQYFFPNMSYFAKTKQISVGR